MHNKIIEDFSIFFRRRFSQYIILLHELVALFLLIRVVSSFGGLVFKINI